MFGIGRKLVFSGLLGTAVGGPYLMTQADQASQAASGAWDKAFGAASTVTGTNPYAQDSYAQPAQSLAAPAAASAESLGAIASPARAELPLEGLVTHDLGQVLRFDISPQWVYQRWARKSTALPELDLFGVRVPLVTGTGMSDMAGSLTYYFGAAGQVERITFRGRTGDARELIALVMSRYGLRRQQPKIPGELLYEVRWNGRAMSRLRITPASVIWASAPHATYAIELDLNRPGAARYLQEPHVDPGPVPTHAPLQAPRAPY